MFLQQSRVDNYFVYYGMMSYKLSFERKCITISKK